MFNDNHGIPHWAPMMPRGTSLPACKFQTWGDKAPSAYKPGSFWEEFGNHVLWGLPAKPTQIEHASPENISGLDNHVCLIEHNPWNPSNHCSTIVLRRTLKWAPIMLRDARLLESREEFFAVRLGGRTNEYQTCKSWETGVAWHSFVPNSVQPQKPSG